MKTVDEAIDFLVAQANPLNETEWLSLDRALGRVLAQPVVSSLNVPPHDNSMMDGYAVRFSDLVEGRVLPVSQRIPAGSHPLPLAPNTAARIFTGAPIPSGADLVIMQEQVEVIESAIRLLPGLLNAQSVGLHIRCFGEDIQSGAEILSVGHCLRAQDLALIASVGQPKVQVYRRLKLVSFTTGSELVEPGKPLEPGQIYNSNRTNLMGLIAGLGFEWIDLGQVEDSLSATLDAFQRAAELGDVVITTGGVSVGEEDHIKPAVEQLGSLNLWQVKMKPGKPLAFGEVCGKPFLGLPGNPVSAFTTFQLFARSFLMKMQGIKQVAPQTIWVRADFEWSKPGFRREFVRARLIHRDKETFAQIFSHQGSGVLTSTVWAAGLVVIPEDGVIKPGDAIEYISFNEF
jgi:molybdopterin molybdotransferase